VLVLKSEDKLEGTRKSTFTSDKGVVTAHWLNKQEAQLSQRGSAMPRVVEYFG